MKTLRRLVSTIMAVCMAVGCLSTLALAADTTTPNTPKALSVENAKKAVTAAGSNDVKLSDIGAVSLDAINALKNDKKVIRVIVDSKTSNDAINVRLSFNPNDVKNSFDASASTISDHAQKTEELFHKYYSNHLVAVACGQTGSYGFTVRMAVKVGSSLKTDNLVLYSYDKAKNTLAKLGNQSYSVDQNGYVHFHTSVGGYIILSDGELVRGSFAGTASTNRPAATQTTPKPSTTTPSSSLPSSSSSSRSTDQVDTDAYAYKVIDIVNKERVAKGLNELEEDGNLMWGAMIRAEEIESNFSHTRPDGTKASAWAMEITGSSGGGENIALGQQTPEAVMKSWMNSSGHKANILRSEYNYIGVGCYQDETGRLHWVQLFCY